MTGAPRTDALPTGYATLITLRWVKIKSPPTGVNQSNERLFGIVYEYAPQNPELKFARTQINRLPYSPPKSYGFVTDNPFKYDIADPHRP